MFVRAEKAIVRLHSCKSNAFRHKDKTNMTLCQSVFSFFNDARTATCVVSTGMTSTRLRSIGRMPLKRNRKTIFGEMCHRCENNA